jgi:hypothetical protein
LRDAYRLVQREGRLGEKHLVVGVDRFGPYSFEAARAEALRYDDGGLYLCIGKRKGEHHKRLQYVGKSNDNLYSRLNRAVDRRRLLPARHQATAPLPVRGRGVALGPHPLLDPAAYDNDAHGLQSELSRDLLADPVCATGYQRRAPSTG